MKPHGPLPGPLGRALAALYRAEIRRRNRRYDSGRGIVTLDRPVISIGNLSVGGTGKTPLVAHAARTLRDQDIRPCIAMRGYGQHAARSTQHSEGGSDEAREYHRLLPGVAVIARPDRLTGLLQLFATEEGRAVRAVLLDDGFQHRRIGRTLDIVLVDASRSPFSDSLLPAGWLREPVESLNRAHFIVITHAEMVEPPDLSALKERIRGIADVPLAVARHAWAGLLIGREDIAAPVAWLGGKSILAVCAIGNPGAFLRGAEHAAGRPLAGRIVLRDHDPYRRATLERILAAARSLRADAILTTEKDWSKLGAAGDDPWPAPIVRARLSLRFDEGEDRLTAALLAAAARMADGDDAGPEPRP